MTDEEWGLAPTAAWMHRAGHIGDAVHVADMLALTWAQLDRALRPVIGRGGVAALYQRSLFLATLAHPWMVDTCESAAQVMDTSPLKAAIASQSPSEAVAAGGSMLLTFHQLLASLIGHSLTARLLRSVWEQALKDPAGPGDSTGDPTGEAP